MKYDMSRFMTFMPKTPQTFHRFPWAIANDPKYLVFLRHRHMLLVGNAMPLMCPHRPSTPTLGGDGVQSGLFVCLAQACFHVFRGGVTLICHES